MFSTSKQYDPTYFPEKPDVYDERGYYHNFDEFRARQVKDYGENYWNHPAYIKEAGVADYIIRKHFDEILNSANPDYALYEYIKNSARTQNSVREKNVGFKQYKLLNPNQRKQYGYYLNRNWLEEVEWRKRHPEYKIQDTSIPYYVVQIRYKETAPAQIDVRELADRINKAKAANQPVKMSSEEQEVIQRVLEEQRAYKKAHPNCISK